MAACNTAASVIPEIPRRDTPFILTLRARKRMIALRFEKRKELRHDLSAEDAGSVPGR